MVESLLKELGFSPYEIQIYLTLIRLKSASAGKIAEEAKVNRRNVYDSLSRLSHKGFISLTIKNGKKTYTPAPPAKIISSFQEKLDIAKNLVPQIQEITSSSREVQVYEGNEGMKTMFNLLLYEQKPVYVIGATGLSIEKMPFFISQLFLKKMRKIKIKQLWNYGAKNLTKYHQLLNSEDRVLPKNLKTSTQIFICGQISVILIWSSLPLAVLIKDSEISSGFKQYFDFLWEISQ